MAAGDAAISISARTSIMKYVYHYRLTAYGLRLTNRGLYHDRGSLARSGFVALLLHLALDHGGVLLAGRHQRLVRAPFDDASVLHQEDEIGPADRGQAVGDDEGRPAREERRHGRLNQLLALGVEIAGGLVENQDLRRGQ